MSHFLDRHFEKIENEGWLSDELSAREATVYGLLCWQFPNIDHIAIVRALRENPEGSWRDDELAIVIKWRDVLAINRYAQELEELPTQDLFAFYRQESKARNIEIEAKRKKELEEEREESSELYEDIKATIINLVLNKFPDLSIYERDLVYDQFFEFEGERASTARPLLLQAKEYQDELWNLPTADLFALERELIGAEEAKYKLSAHGSINRGWFFDQPDAQADFEYWSKAEYWTSDEAVAISFGKNPKVVTGEALKNYLGKAQFADNYFLRCDLLDRAIQSDRLPREIPPADFLEWAHQRSIPIPRELTDYLSAIEAASSQSSAKPLSDTGRDSLLKLVLGMSIDSYGYKVGEMRNPATGENRGSIAAALERLDLKLTPDTIRKYLKEAEQRFGDPLKNLRKD